MQTSQALDRASSQALPITGHWPALAVMIFGLAILYCVGFSTFPEAHNAAHDTRHANGFPCH